MGSPRITALFSELETKLKALPAYKDTITFRLGADERAQEDAPPRIAWVLTQATFSGAEKRARSTRRLITRRLQVAAVCWGKDLDELEQLLHDLIWTLHKTTWGSLELVGETWPEQQATHHGLVAVLTFAVQIPVEEPALPTTKITTIENDTTGSAQGDGLLDWGET